MSEISELLREISARGLSIGAAGGDLRLQGPRDRMDAALVGRIKALKPDLVEHLAREAGPAAPEGFGVTLLQRGYLIGRGDLLELGGVSSHIYHEIEGFWDLGRLETALRSVVARHGMLRTRFTPDGRQVTQDSADIAIDVLDLRALSAEAQEARRTEIRNERSHRVLPADRAPLVAVEVTRLAEDRMVLHVGHDGLVMDGISQFLFFRQWWHAYNDGVEPDAPEEASFEAYITALEAARDRAPARRSRQYWLDRLPTLAPHPDLPLRTSPAAIARTRFTQHAARLEAAAWTAVRRHAADRGLTPTALLFAAYGEALARWGAGPRFCLATTLANRPPIHPRINDAVGNFSETLLVEIEVDRDLPFEDRARAVQARLRKDLDNRHFSGIEVLRELGRREGAAQARMPYSFNSTIGYVQADLDGSTLELFGPETYTSSQTPQLWLNGFAFEQHGGLVVQVDSVDGLFPEGLVEAMVAGFEELLRALTQPEAWSARTFDLMPAEQKARRRAANDTAVELPDVRLTDAFLAQAAAAPDAAAVVTERLTLGYGELARRAAQAAAWLREHGVGRDELVGLVMTRGPEQIVGILAAVLAGAAYLPVDAALPDERKRYMLRDGRVRCVLTNDPARVPQDEGLAVFGLDCSEPFAAAEQTPDLPDLPGASLDDLAYVLYTSGTTGEPKGVMVSRRSVLNLVRDCTERFGLDPADRFFGISAFNFDLSVFDVFGALSAGAAVVLPEADRSADPAHWLDLCAKAGVTVWNSVPAIAGLLHDQAAADGAAGLATLRLVMMSGDRIPPDLPARLRRLVDGLAVVSLGGPTETTVWNILHPVGPEEDGSKSIPYGRPNSNNRAYVIDAAGQDAPDWITGEICAAGVGVARGYWGDEARTAERFFVDEARGERLYRTGDLGRYLPDGEIEILGRGDFQIKVNGYRIEAGEVETRLVAIPGVEQAAVVRQAGPAGAAGAGSGARLVAHLVASVPVGTELPTENAIRQALREHLPEYMTPSAVVWHEALPLTRNGKVDRARLSQAGPAVGGRTVPSPGAGGPATETEQALIELWASVLRVAASEVSPDTDFYELGGESLAAARILTGVRKRFGVGVGLDRLAEMLTVRAMGAVVEAAVAAKGASRGPAGGTV